ncbi:MAG: monovalent cation/H(+) antiporter subunit G [Planctomycetota bacterium]|nr:monovalent cation/H(+) antiporter subunit G [Planctomycetota bacterium]
MTVDVASWAFLLLGSFFSIVGGIGIIRLPEFFSRLHAGGVTDTLGATLIVVGLLLQVDSGLIAIKLLMILFFLLVTSPTSCHALAKSAISEGLEPVLDSPQPGESLPAGEESAE